MNQYFVYILLCGYTSTRLPVKLVFWEKFQTPDHAIEFEKQVKGWSRKKKEAIIEGNWNKLKELAVCANDSHFRNLGKSPFDSAQGDNINQNDKTKEKSG